MLLNELFSLNKEDNERIVLQYANEKKHRVTIDATDITNVTDSDCMFQSQQRCFMQYC